MLDVMGISQVPITQHVRPTVVMKCSCLPMRCMSRRPLTVKPAVTTWSRLSHYLDVACVCGVLTKYGVSWIECLPGLTNSYLLPSMAHWPA